MSTPTAPQETAPVRRRRELGVFLFLTVVLAPLLSVAIVGAFGFAIWISQLLLGPPGS